MIVHPLLDLSNEIERQPMGKGVAAFFGPMLVLLFRRRYHERFPLI